MNNVFECEYLVNRKKYFVWGKDCLFHNTQQLVIISLWTLFASMVFFFSVYSKWYILIWGALFLLYRGMPRWFVLFYGQYEAMTKDYCTKVWLRKFLISEEGITLSEASLSYTAPYEDVARLKEKNDYILISLKNGNSFRLYRDCFVNGNLDDCRKYLSARVA